LAPTGAQATGAASDTSLGNQPIPGHYIVVVKPGIAASMLATASGVKPTHVYDHALNGFAAALSPAQLDSLRHNSNVAYIEPDREISIADDETDPPISTLAIQRNPTWGLDRIDERTLPLSKSYAYNRTGRGVYVYIIDTGIQTSHPEFGGRAEVVYDALGGNGQDCNGHGTHVAGTVGGKTYGVAKQAYLRAVRVLNCFGTGTYSSVIAGVNWVTRYHRLPAVANLSLGGSNSPALNAAVTNMVRSGVFTAVAAGNYNGDACQQSPASAAGVATVAASTIQDGRASFSNFGRCVEIYAPGVNIRSAWLNRSIRDLSGTSMASPHVAGVAALYKAHSQHPRPRAQ
jgi:subtilisin family serine protease